MGIAPNIPRRQEPEASEIITNVPKANKLIIYGAANEYK